MMLYDNLNIQMMFLSIRFDDSLHRVLECDFRSKETEYYCDQMSHHPNLLYYDIEYNHGGNFAQRDSDLLLIENLLDDRNNNLSVFLCSRLYDNLHKLFERDFPLMENYFGCGQNLHHPNQMLYDINYNL